MRRRRTAALVALVLLTACARAEDRTSAPPTDEPTATATRQASPSPTATETVGPVGRPIELPALPAQGVAVERGHGVVFIGLDGAVVARLPRFHLEYTWTVPGPIVLRRHPHEFFVMREHTHVVVPIGDADAAVRVSPQFQPGFGPEEDPDLPYPLDARVEGHPELLDGMWVYALPAPDGARLLAQWSGECEVPNAFFIDGREVVTVDGFRRISRAAETWALGWTTDGRALVTAGGGPCSSAFEHPGVYFVDAPGVTELLVATDGPARMWNPA